MATRYVDAKRLQYEADKFFHNEDRVLYELTSLIAMMPTADVVEAKHGEWIYHECVSSYDGAISGYSCSVCSAFVNEEVFESDEFHKDFCGHCGAKMDGERRGT